MAALAEPALTPIVIPTKDVSPSPSNTSRRLFSGLISREPRDSLEAIRKKNLHSHVHSPLAGDANPLIQVSEQEDDEEDGESSAPGLAKLPLVRGALCSRHPRGKAVVLALFTSTIASYAFGAAITGILTILDTNYMAHHSFFSLSHAFFQHCISRLFYPVAGFIADVYMGRYAMIRASLFLILAGYFLLTISFLAEKRLQHGVEGLMALRVVAFLVISAGGGGVEATIIPFGIDQLQGATSSETSSYLFFFYFWRNLALVAGIMVYSGISSSTFNVHFIPDTTFRSTLQLLVSMVVLTGGIVVDSCFNHWYFKDKQRENPLKLVFKVLGYAALVKRKMPRFRRAFRYGEGKLSRIELAKQQYDGKYSSEQVEDVKIFCRICLILISVSPTFSSSAAMELMVSYEINTTLNASTKNFHTVLSQVYPNLYMLLNAAGILISVPIINHFMIPCVPWLSIRARLGMGLLLNTIGNFFFAVIYASFFFTKGIHSKEMIYLYIIPIFLVAVAEALTVVSLLEFIYAQSPESMKGLLIGLLFLVIGLSGAASIATFFKFPKTKNSHLSYHLAFTAISLLGLIFYGIVACLHTNRQRPDDDSYTKYDRMQVENQVASRIESDPDYNDS